MGIKRFALGIFVGYITLQFAPVVFSILMTWLIGYLMILGIYRIIRLTLPLLKKIANAFLTVIMTMIFLTGIVSISLVVVLL